MSKVFALITGGWIAVMGFYLVIGKEFSFRGTKISFGTANALVGWAFIVLGLIILVIASRTKAKHFEETFVICPKCKEPLNHRDVPDQRCPRCNAEVEDLVRFYEKHPELTKEKKTSTSEKEAGS